MKLNVLQLQTGGTACGSKLLFRRGVVHLDEEIGGGIGDVLTEMKFYRDAPLILVGGVEGAVVVESVVPELKRDELKEYLDFELGCHVPGEFEDMVWYGRIVAHLDGNVKVRCCVIPDTRDRKTLPT